ncbi:MAG: hypothetical protein CL811_04385, partial [Colwelliaceae bacterium]|nr:hypothetical protein [Colwelliaceae bacterium]
MSLLTKNKTMLATAITVALSPLAMADDVADKEIEEIAVIAKKLSYANNTIDQNMIEQQAPISSVLAVMDNLPGININEG